MNTIDLDDRTAEGLTALAESKGLTVEEYLRSLVGESAEGEVTTLTASEFDEELDKIAFNGPSLPNDFSRRHLPRPRLMEYLVKNKIPRILTLDAGDFRRYQDIEAMTPEVVVKDSLP